MRYRLGDEEENEMVIRSIQTSAADESTLACRMHGQGTWECRREEWEEGKGGGKMWEKRKVSKDGRGGEGREEDR